MRPLRSVACSFAFSVASTISASTGSLSAQGRTIDEGTFSVTVAGSAGYAENFKIARGENGLVTATGHVLGQPALTSSLTVDSAGTPVKYELTVRENGAQTLRIMANGLPGRLTTMSSDARGDQSMHDFPLKPGRSMILDDGLVHQLYFFGLNRHGAQLEVIMPRESRTDRLTFAAKGLEPVTVGGRSLTGTHYVLGDGVTRREFWVDAAGRLLRVEIPSRRLIAVRDEPPK